MAVIPDDIVFFQSLDTDSLGGPISATPVTTTLDTFFNPVLYDEADTGSVAYRCIYVKNINLTDTLELPSIYIAVLTPSPSTFCRVALGSAGLNGAEPSIATENNSPVGTLSPFLTPTLSDPLSFIDPGPTPIDLAPGDFYPLWVARTVLSDAVGSANDTVVLAVTGDGGI